MYKQYLKRLFLVPLLALVSNTHALKLSIIYHQPNYLFSHYTETTACIYSPPYKQNEIMLVPVRFNVFNVKREKESVALTWQTVEEQNSLHYLVERSKNGRTYEAIATLPTKQGNDVSTYSFKDKAPLEGRSYYRIRQIDKDGAHILSPVRSILRVPDRMLQIIQRNQVLIAHYYSEGKKLYALHDMQGNLLQKGIMINNKCIITGLTPGPYILNIQTAAATITTQVMVIQ